MSKFYKETGIWGADVPLDFPLSLFDELTHNVLDGRDTNTEARARMERVYQFNTAMIGVQVRFVASAEHSDEFTRIHQRHGGNTPGKARYEEERALFGFFFNGLSCLECLFYGLHWMASLAKASAFRRRRDRVHPKTVANAIAQEFPDQRLGHVLVNTLRTREYRSLAAVRNVLAHRVAPGKIISLGGGTDHWQIRRIKIRETLTSARREWLARRLSFVLRSAVRFSERVPRVKHEHD